MRLRYLALSNLAPLEDITIVFGRDTILKRACTIRFVVGVNGTGKTRLLQALAEVFLCLERRRVPPFPITLVYDLVIDAQERTFLLHYPGGQASTVIFVEFTSSLLDRNEEEWKALIARDWQTNLPSQDTVQNLFSGGDLPGAGAINAYLPSILLAYTSGAVRSWRELFTMPLDDSAIATLPDLNDDGALELERPPSWNDIQEADFQRQQGVETPPRMPNAEIMDDGAFTQSVGRLATSDNLPLAVCAVALQQSQAELTGEMTRERLAVEIEQGIANSQPMSGLRGLLNEVGWLWLESVHLRIRFTPEHWARPLSQQIAQLYTLATAVIRQPEPSKERLLCFDLFRPAPDEPNVLTMHKLLAVLGGEQTTPFDVFSRLADWQADGLLTGVTMTVRKLGVNDLLLYDWLSDGERMFLGRMALFHLLRGKSNALIILDEPETHFNDVWKRQIVDIIDENLREDASEVVISTHSSIALTDVFDEEIELLRHQDGRTVVGHITTPTFGSDPSEIMIQVFDAPDSIGKRALAYLDSLLEQNWNPAQRDELEQIIRNIGPGYHRSELRTIWRQLNAVQD